jgi:hypothetical protein
MNELSLLTELTSRVLDNVAIVHDYIQLKFLDGTVLNLNNDVGVDGQLVPSSSLGESQLRSLVGLTVREVGCTAELLTISFDGVRLLTMTLKPQDWRSPEAVVLYLPGEPPVVWT